MILKPDRPSKLFTHWEDQPVLAWTLSILWVAFICFIAFWWRLGSTGLVDETEPLFAEASRQMGVTGNWVTPYFNGVTRFDKPPLVYWLMAIAFKFVGVNSWAVRFPSALAATVLTGMGFYTLRHCATTSVLRDRWLTAWIGSALIALNIHTIAWARIGVSDMLLSGCMGSALFAFFMGYAQGGRSSEPPPTPPILGDFRAKASHTSQSPPILGDLGGAQSRWYLAFYIFTALSVLTKGPVGILLPVLIIGIFLLYTGNLRTVLKEMRWIRGSLLFLALTVPWYALVIQANGEAYINAFFGYHNLERFSQVVNNHRAPWWYFFAVVPISFAPWSIYLPVAIARLRFWNLPHWRTQPPHHHLALFALIWFTVIFGFFTIAATKLPSYTLPLIPAAAVLVALFWSDSNTEHRSTRSSRGDWISHIISILFALLLAGASLLSPRWLEGDQDMPDLQTWAEQLGMPTLAAGVWGCVAIASLILLLRRQGHWLWSVQLLGFLTFLVTTLLPFTALVDAQRQRPLRQIASTITHVRQPHERLIMAGYNKPSLVFYTQSPFVFISEHDKVLPYIKRIKRNRRNHSVLLVVRTRKLKDTRLNPNQYQVLSQSGVFQLIRVNLLQ
jgi:4-amino-4-deoxy-L-arabinose transferase-like glycosyltransferase